jgi:AcrR family transcriptional regulator
VKTRTRLSCEERRDSIIGAARKIFSEKGFHGTTTRELAGAARVSEALLFKHFPNKQAIYLAMLDECHKTEISAGYQKLLTLEPSTSTLMVILHFLFTKLIAQEEEPREFHRLLLRSMSEDGEFARVFLEHIGSTFVPVLRDCLNAAERDGDLRGNAHRLKTGAWLTQHLILMIGFVHVSSRETVNYKAPKEKLAEEAVVFCLRGLGVRDEAIEKFYNPKALALFVPV